MYSIKQNY